MSEVKNILIVGTGGQGVILASDILSDVLSSDHNLQVKKIETHGMSQRGGSVHSQVRFGREVHAPFISPGEAEIILAFEEAEGLRWSHYLSPAGIMLLNNEKIIPPLVQSGLAQYPDAAIAVFKKDHRVISVDGFKLACKAGNAKVVSVALLGALSPLLDFDSAVWAEILKRSVPENALRSNLLAFEAGRKLMQEKAAWRCRNDADQSKRVSAAGH